MKGVLRFSLSVLTALTVSLQARAITFISDVKVCNNTSTLSNEGYTPLYYDLNAGAGGEYIYIGYKTTTDPTQAITGLKIYAGEGYGNNTYLYNGISESDGKVYYKAPFSGTGNQGDLNADAGGEYLYLYYSKTGAHDINVQPITSININGAGTTVSDKDLNSGAGGEYIYLRIASTHSHNNSGLRYNNNSTHTFYCTSCGTYMGESSYACGITTTTTEKTHLTECTTCHHVWANGAHTFVNGICTYDNYYQPAVQAADGYYLLANAGNMLWWNNQKSGGSQFYVARMTADIDLNPGYVFNNDGTYTAPSGAHRLEKWDTPSYSPSFDGGGHVLSGLYSVGDYGGLCGELNGTNIYVRDLIIRDSYVEGTLKAGAITVRVYNANVVNCAAINIKGTCKKSTTQYGISAYRGGSLVGENLNGKVVNCYAISPGSTLPYACGLTYNANGATNSYGLNGSGDLRHFTGKDADAFSSGELVWLLNGGKSNGPWHMTIGVDTVPVFKGSPVYARYDSDGKIIGYTNRSTGDVTADGETCVADITKLIDGVLRDTIPYGNADVDNDGAITLSDVLLLADKVMEKDGFVEISSLSVSGLTTMKAGGSQTLVATVHPANAQLPYVSWSSSDASVISVDSKGRAKALKEGSATITASAVDNSGVVATIYITVRAN